MNVKSLNKIRMLSLAIPTLALSTLGLGGCAQLQNYSGNLWQGTQSVGASLVAFLRPAPQQKAQFLAETPTAISASPDSFTDSFTDNLEYSVDEKIQPVQLAWLRGVSNIDIGDQNKAVTRPIIPVLIAELSAPILPSSIAPVFITIPTVNKENMLAGAPTTPRTVSLIKTTGQTQAQDLSLCAQTAGKTLVEKFTGYEINPDFLTCMHGIGYRQQ